jgi:hypothetical protein
MTASATRACGPGKIEDFCRAVPPHGFRLANGVFTTIDGPGASLTVPYRSNNRGRIVGGYFDLDEKVRGLLRDAKEAVSQTRALDINDWREVVGIVWWAVPADGARGGLRRLGRHHPLGGARAEGQGDGEGQGGEGDRELERGRDGVGEDLVGPGGGELAALLELGLGLGWGGPEEVGELGGGLGAAGGAEHRDQDRQPQGPAG